MGNKIINSVYKKGMAFSTELEGHSITIDLTAEHGGNNLGPGPKSLMLVSLAGCTGVDVVAILNKMKVVYADLSIKVEAHVTEEHPKIYDAVTVTYTIRVSKADEPRVKKAVDLSQEKYCGVSEMFRAFSKLSSQVVYLR
ncbi:MAG: OsmC family protein [Ginsengibacter sp.]